MRWSDSKAGTYYRVYGTMTTDLARIPVVVGYLKKHLDPKARVEEEIPPGHDLYKIVPMDYAEPYEDRMEDLKNDLAAWDLLFHRLDSWGWDQVKLAIEHELTIRGFVPNEPDDLEL